MSALANAGTVALPLPGYSLARRSGRRITWEQDYQAARDATGACVPCATAALLNPKFCNVNIVPDEGCLGHHDRLPEMSIVGSSLESMGTIPVASSRYSPCFW